MKTQNLGSVAVRDLTLTLTLASVLAVATLLASATPTNLMDMTYNPLTLRLDDNYKPNPSFIEAYENSLSTRADKFLDRLGGPSAIKWLRDGENHRYGTIERYNRAAAETFGRAMTDSFRDVFADYIPVDEWRDNSKEFMRGIFLSFVKGSVGNSREPDVDLTSPVLTATEDAWITESLARRERFKYGYRAFRPDPYAYTTFVWTKRNGNLRAMLHARYRTTPMDTDNPLGRVELSLTMPIYHGYRFSIGGSVKPARMQAESGWAGTVRFERKIAESLPLQGRAQRPVIAYAGLRIANREPTTIDIGIYTTF